MIDGGRGIGTAGHGGQRTVPSRRLVTSTSFGGRISLVSAI